MDNTLIKELEKKVETLEETVKKLEDKIKLLTESKITEEAKVVMKKPVFLHD